MKVISGDNFASVKRMVFNPLLKTEAEIIQFLGPLEEGTGHPLCAGTSPHSRKILCKVDRDTINVIDVSDRPESFFRDSINLDLVREKLDARMQVHAAGVQDVCDYALLSLTDAEIEIPLVHDQILVMALSVNTQPSYYDLYIGVDSGSYVSYGKTTNAALPGLRHSGDIVSNGHVLLHKISMTHDLLTETFTIFVVGYSNNRLSLYEEQRPAVLIANHATRSLYIVPVPLDEASIQDNVHCCPLVGRRVGNTIKLVLSSNPPAGSGSFVPTIQKAIREARFGRAVAPPSIESSSAQTDAPADNLAALSISDSTVPLGSTVLVWENGCTVPDFYQPSVCVRFGLGLEVSYNMLQPAEASSDNVFPICLGTTLEGPYVLAIGHNYQGPVALSQPQLLSLYSQARGVVVVVSDKMNDQARLLNPKMRLNALFVVQPLAKEVPLAALDKLEARNEFLANVNINAVTCLAGPQAIVVVAIRDNFYFYRGVRWEGTFPTTFQFGQDVTDQVRNYLPSQQPRLPWRLLTDLTEDQFVYFQNQQYRVEKMNDLFQAMEFDQVLGMKADVKDVIVQLQVLLGSEAIQALSAELLKLVKAKMDTRTGTKLDEFVSFMKKSGHLARSSDLAEREAFLKSKNELTAALKNTEREVRDTLQWLINDIANMSSNRASSSKNSDLKQLLRKNQIADNVAAAENMDQSQYLGILAQHCRLMGAMVGNVEESVLKELLPNVANGRLLVSVGTRPVSSADNPISTMRNEEMQAVLAHLNSGHTGPLSSFDPKRMSLSIAQGFEGPQLSQSAIPWPLFDEFITLEDPAFCHWITKCNDAHIAQIRIASKSTIAHSVAARKMGVTAQSPDMGYLLVLLVMDLMQDIARTMDASTSFGFDDEKCSVMRGLFGHLLTILASGSKPLSMAWQMVQSNP
ncbi:hypothetical protein HDU91_007218, partial [Kappamyces sp. JEL0680]